MRRPLEAVLRLLYVSATNMAVGAGLGVVVGWAMSTGEALDTRIAAVSAVSYISSILGLLFGWIAYYAIFRQRVRYESFCVVVTVTGLTTAAAAYVLHISTGTGGWLALFVATAVSLGMSYVLRPGREGIGTSLAGRR